MSKRIDAMNEKLQATFGTKDLEEIRTKLLTASMKADKTIEERTELNNNMVLFQKADKLSIRKETVKADRVTMTGNNGIFRNIYTVYKKLAEKAQKSLSFSDFLLALDTECDDAMKSHMEKSIVKFVESGKDSDDETDLDDEIDGDDEAVDELEIDD